jgi:flagellar biosynthesis protein FlhA
VEEHVNQFLETDRLCLEIGRQLTSLVDSPTTKGLRDVLGGLRRDLTRKYGLWVPTIRVVESVDLFPNEYRILIGGREVARGNLRIDRYLAIDPGSKTTLTVDGEETADPTFGLPAKWIQASDRRRAQLAGYTVVDAPTVLITHFGEVIRRHAHELLSREDLHTMLEKVKETAQTVVEDLMKPDLIRMGVLHQVLVHLLAEGIPITNLPLILESIAHHAAYVKDPVQLTERVRGDIGRTICDRFRDERGRVRVIMFEPALELAMRDYVRDGNLALPPGPLEKLLGGLSAEWGKACLQGRPVALVVEGHIRRLVRQTILRPLSDLAVIAVNEIPGDLLIETVAMLRLGEVFVAATTGAGPRTEQPNKPSGRDGPGRRVAAA